MDERVYRILEFDSVKKILADHAQSPMAVKDIGELAPLTKAHEIRERLKETDEAVRVILSKGSLPLGGLCDIKKKARYAEKGRVLGMDDLLDIAASLRAAAEVKKFLNDGELSDIPLIKEYGDLLNDESRFAERISSCIVSREEMADNASPALRDIRRRIAREQAGARSRINSIISSQTNKDMLQDAVVTMREGRLVIPVKQEHRARFPGIVHDSSASGATLFIEPQSVVDINNEIRELENKEREEIMRILKELSAEVGHRVRHIVNNQKYLTRLDVIFAKARMSIDMNCTAAELSEDGVLDIRQGRHPLIDPDKVVPLDITAGETYKTLIITGPNTGGKTVALKTAGLLVLMNQAGMHVPAAPGTVLPIMDDIYADIGDEQSIEQSLSTFSAHMKNIVEITKNAGSGTFVLLDELGAGTDPAEGAALAMSILEYLAEKGSLIFATTHYSELKKYALATEGVENASMEFDAERLCPTYRMIIGMPGKSNAFEISRRLGLDEEIIASAGSKLASADIEFEDLISSIEQEHKAAERELAQARALRAKLEREEEEARYRIAANEEKSRQALEKARQRASDTVAEAREFSEEVRKELRQLRKAAPEESARKEQDIRRQIREKGNKYRRSEEPKKAENTHPAKKSDIKVGARVRVVSLDKKGIIAGLPDDKDEVLVQIGLMKMRMPLSDLSLIDSHGVQKTFEKTSYGKMYRQKAQAISPEINVIGMNLDEARMEVDKYLDDAYMSGLSQVRIIHGRGTGVLRGGIRDMLKRNRHVDSFRSADYNDGGEGATIVKLRQ
ncbi:MAG: endonuclease MutS2 [Anaerovoracaceae bacterium]|nr:endonuclease MutS2 [Bacillota bacterium]MDY2670164.1 endonuclease MutS2 [Anaerovoracaceae bacterium]